MNKLKLLLICLFTIYISSCGVHQPIFYSFHESVTSTNFKDLFREQVSKLNDKVGHDVYVEKPGYHVVRFVNVQSNYVALQYNGSFFGPHEFGIAFNLYNSDCFLLDDPVTLTACESLVILTIYHEIGHQFKLGHASDKFAIMNAYISYFNQPISRYNWGTVFTQEFDKYILDIKRINGIE